MLPWIIHQGPAALRTFAQDTDAGAFVADPRLTGAEPPAWLPADLLILPERLATGADAQALAESLGMDRDRVAAILWLLAPVEGKTSAKTIPSEGL